MENHEDDFPIEVMSQILNVSRSGYYDWRVRPISRRDLVDKDLFMEVEKIYYEFGEGMVLREFTGNCVIGESGPPEKVNG